MHQFTQTSIYQIREIFGIWGDGMVLEMAVLIFAVNLDSFITGLAYGLSGIVVSKGARITIALAAGMSFALSMAAGDLLAVILPVRFAQLFSCLILCCFGVYWLWKMKHQSKKQSAKKWQEGSPHPSGMDLVFQLKLEFLGVMVQILRQPNQVDYNQDAKITVGEALLLGVALSMDSLGAGLALGVMGCSPGITIAFTVILNFILLSLAVLLGKRLGKFSRKMNTFAKRYSAYIPAIVILILGTWKLSHYLLRYFF